MQLRSGTVRTILLLLAFVFFSSANAQNLTVRQIMAEPSIAGQRVEGEKLSPDGTKVVFLWNAEGKPRRDLYIVSTAGGTPEKILSPDQLPAPQRPAEKPDPLGYGVVIRDQFVRDRENQLGNFEWSPDSSRLIFTYGGDIYLLSLFPGTETPDSSSDESTWKMYLATMLRRSLLIPNIIEASKRVGVDEADLFSNLVESNDRLRASIESSPVSSSAERDEIIRINREIDELIERVRQLYDVHPALRSSEAFMKALDEITGTENRINVARVDYEQNSRRATFKRITKTQSPEFGARFLDNDRVLYSQGGNAFVLHLADATLTQVTREANAQQFISVGNIAASKDGKMAAYVVSDGSKQRQLVVPNFLPEYVTGGGPRRGWTEQKLMFMPTDGSRDAPHEIELPKPEGVSSFRRMVWAADNRSLIVDRLDKDTKRRQLFYIYNVGSKDEKIILVTEETDDKWQAPKSAIFEPNPKNPAQLFFASERDGFNHLYLATLELPSDTQAETRPVGRVSSTEKEQNLTGSVPTPSVKTEQLTKGNWQVEWAKWKSGERLLYLSTESGTATRDFGQINTTTKNRTKFYSSVQKGMITGPQLSENDSPTLVFSGSQWNRPEELIAYFDNCPQNSQSRYACPEVSSLLSKTTPDAFLKRNWTEPKFIEIPSRDGKKIPAKIYLPPGHDSKKKYPMVIFVHGAGYLQNVINGWNNYYREFMFNDMLAKKGYVVLDIDFRGSAGYGREWRTDVHDFLGGKDFDDHIDSIDHMVKNYGVDQRRIGVYGGSYGGFMAGMLVLRAPERIAAAAALRSVFDWKNYYAANPFYTAQRLGFPDKNPEAYRRSSPIAYADKLERPFLILHGMADDNVHVQDSVQMIEQLIRLGKTQYFEAMLYPSENHGFVRPESWADEYERILAFFEKHLAAK
ncbi:MAG: alpha/beta fold hydrolase [Acidobacteria bacterium]|nr:alpha/beta fold hydrolase [Acidobacteriota bacterium]